MYSRTDRIAFIDALKCFAIFLVVCGHVLQYLQPLPYSVVPMYRLIYTFHMPLFMMLAGFFAANVSDKDFKAFFSGKAVRLLLPVVSFCVVFQVLIFGSTLYGALYYSYWFPKSLFVCTAMYYVCGGCFRKRRVAALVVSLVLSQFIFTWQIHKMYPCFVAGTLLARNYTWVVRNMRSVAAYSGILFLALLCFVGTQWNPFPSGQMHPGVSYLLRHSHRLVIGLAGSCAFFCLFCLAGVRMRRSRIGDVLLSFGRDTLGVYLVQVVVLEILMDRYIEFTSIDTTLFSLVVAPALALVLTVGCVLCVRLLRRFRLTRLLFLGEK